MIRRTSAIAALLWLAACQGTSSSLRATAPSVHGAEPSRAELERRVEELEERLAEAEARSALIEGSSLNLELDPAAAIHLAARVEGLSRTVEQLRVIMMAGASARPVEASHGDRTDGGDDALREGLARLEEACALHCENIANVAVPGYKRRTQLLASIEQPTGGIRQPRSAGAQLVMTQGALWQTGKVLDLAVKGAGFFELELPGGERGYTRNGSLLQDANGRLVSAEGYLLTDQVQIPPDSQGISISPDGEVYSLGEGNVQNQIGTIRLHVFPNPTGLRAMGGNYFAGTPSSGDPAAVQPTTAGAGMVKQGYLERSNVETVDELVSLIVAQRNYEVNSRAIRVSDEMLQQVNQLIR